MMRETYEMSIELSGTTIKLLLSVDPDDGCVRLSGFRREGRPGDFGDSMFNRQPDFDGVFADRSLVDGSIDGATDEEHDAAIRWASQVLASPPRWPSGECTGQE